MPTTPQYRLSEVNECIAIDLNVKKFQDEIASVTKDILKSGTDANRNRLKYLQQQLAYYENQFAKLSCRDKIEYKRMVDSGGLLTDLSIKQEQDLLPKNQNEQMIYIGLGAVVVLVALIMVVKD